MIEPSNKNLSIAKQCKILKFSRSNYYYESRSRKEDISTMNRVVEQYEKTPFYGHKKTAHVLNIGEKKIRNIRRKLKLKTLYPKPSLSIPNIEHIKYPYLLSNLKIERLNQVWTSDITYIKLPIGSVYLVAIKDIFSRKLLSWELSNTLNTEFCLSALRRALDEYGAPEIHNSDQGCQYTSAVYTDELKRHKIKISMDSKGRAIDNIYIERFWRTLKYENIFLNSYESIMELEDGLNNYINFYNDERIHQSLNYATPNEIYLKNMNLKTVA